MMLEKSYLHCLSVDLQQAKMRKWDPIYIYSSTDQLTATVWYTYLTYELRTFSVNLAYQAYV